MGRRALRTLAGGVGAGVAATLPAGHGGVAGADEIVRLPERAPAADVRAARVWAKLETVRVSVDFDAMGVVECLAYLKRVAGVNVVLSPQARDDFYLADRPVTLQVTDLPLGSVLRLVLDQTGLVARWKHGLLYVGRETEQIDPPVLRLYDVRDITLELHDYPGPELRLEDGSAGTSAISWIG